MKSMNKKEIKIQNKTTNSLLKQRFVYVDSHAKNILYEQGTEIVKRRELRNARARKER